MKQPTQKIQDIAEQIQVLNPFDDSHNWDPRRPEVDAPEWNLEPKDDDR